MIVGFQSFHCLFKSFYEIRIRSLLVQRLSDRLTDKKRDSRVEESDEIIATPLTIIMSDDMATERVLIVLALCILLAKCDNCHFGKHPSVPGDSCSHVLQIQPDCYGENGFYWIRGTGSDLEYVYCDMEHKGGGWRRVLLYHSDSNTTCPGNLVAVSLYSGTHTYCKRDPPALLYSIFEWNKNEEVQYSEIRGYVNLRVHSGTYPRAFHYYTPTPPEYGVIDGIDIMAGIFPGGYIRSIFAYIVGSKGISPDNCPVNGGDEYGTFRLNYRDYAYACDEIDVTSSSIDSEGIFNQDLFTSTDCVQCPLGGPWFEIQLANNIPDGRIQFRMVNADAGDDTIYLTDMEIYVR